MWRAAGISETRLSRLVRDGELVKIRYGVYATAAMLAEAESDPRLAHAVEVAAATARTHKGVASHHSAARIYGLDLLREPADGTVTLTVPPAARTGRHSQAHVIQHAAELPDQHVSTRYGQLVTVAARTVVDIARTSTFMAGVVVADSALRERHTSKTELHRVLAFCERWPGSSRARQVIDFASPVAESALESWARVSFRDQGLPTPELQVNIIGRGGGIVARVDFFWRSSRRSRKPTVCSSTTAATRRSPSSSETDCCARRASRSSTSPGRNSSPSPAGSPPASARPSTTHVASAPNGLSHYSDTPEHFWRKFL